MTNTTFFEDVRYRMSVNIPLLGLHQVVKLLSISMHSFSCLPALWGAVVNTVENLICILKKGLVFCID